MPMGNPLSPTIANIVLDTLLEESIKDLEKEKINIKLITKYVDDLFAIIKRSDEEKILKTINSYHNKLKFTIEKEENNSIAYLDMKLHREKGRIITDWYMKPIASGRIINYNSTQPMKQKMNTANNILKKAINISDKKFKNKNINIIKDMLIKNNYPKNLINNIINKVTNNISTRVIDKNNTSGNTKYYGVPFIPKLTENKKLKEIAKEENITFAHKPNKTINHLFTQTKTTIQNREQSNVVYEITCSGKAEEECGKVYIGTTKRHLGTRVDEHKADIRKGKLTTALAQHCIENGHEANFDEVKILDKERRENKRYTLESLRIQQRSDCAINTKEDKDNANANYSIILV